MKTYLPLWVWVISITYTYAQPTQDYMEIALKTEQWLASTALDQNGELAWSNVKDSTEITTELYSGNSGIVLFYLELYKTTKKRVYLEKAQKSIAYILRNRPNTWTTNNIGLYTGIMGIGYTAHQVYLQNGDKSLLEETRNLFWEIGSMINSEEVSQNLANDIVYGYAGIGLTYLYAHEHKIIKKALSYAKMIGDTLLKKSVAGTQGLRWTMFMKDTLRQVYYPNFSHGTAGVCYFLACLYEKTKDHRYLEASLKGASHLASITNDSGWVYHVEPTGKDRYYMSWCHGAAGTARLYYKLFQITKDAQWKDKILWAAKTTMQCGIPQKRTKGFWNNVSVCCGNAGIANFYMQLYQIFKNPEYLAYTKILLDDLIKRSTQENGQIYWVQAENRTHPQLMQAQTGLMQGSSGIGVTLLQLYQVEKKKQYLIKLPDNPF
jgi:lantibiotic modifying enzyme